jgi:hypothetical protein
MANNANLIPILSAKTIAASGNELSQAIELDWYALNGFFSLQVVLTGDGTGKFQWAVSNDNTNFIISADASDDIVTAHTKASGPGADGIHIYSFDPIVAGWLKIKCTETGGANNITVTTVACMQ